ncbi:MAG: DUF2267 domain-containing protein [Chloroflexi bacterium]|nr:DUF2267 domain-containing protein [Chloroflexota bacterium]
MQYDEFVGQVQNRARLASNGEAVTAIRATLQTLAERLAGGAAENLAAQLPREIGEYLRDSSVGELSAGERLSLDEFFARVSRREQKDLPTAIHDARVVCEVLQEAVSAGEIEKIRAQLPAEYGRLFDVGSTGRAPRKGRRGKESAQWQSGQTR